VNSSPRRLALALALALLVSLSAPAAARPRAAAGSGKAWEWIEYQRIIQSPIEQYTGDDTWIVNPTQCPWDLDDNTYQIGNGSVGAGQTVTGPAECVISSQNPYWMTINGNTGWFGWSLGWYGAQVQASVGTLVVSVCYQPEGRCFTAAPVYDAAQGLWFYNSCTQAAYDPGDPRLVEIAGSGGGVGVPQTVVTTISNPAGRSVRDVWATIGAVGAPYYAHGSFGCVKDAPTLTDYPFRYTQ